MRYEELLNTTRTAAGLRLRLRLQPMYGEGEILFPCTVAGGGYLTSPRRIPGYDGAVMCTILDSVQSQANRMEERLLADIREGKFHVPHVETDFTGVEGLQKEVGKITCFDAPHRVFDAILRDSVDAAGKHFPFTDEGAAAIRANSGNASPLFRISPASLLFGSWDSTGVSGGLGEKYTRCVVSEIVAVDVQEGVRGGTRVDPLNADKNQSPAKILKEASDEMWEALKKSRKKFDKPSEINHSSVPWGNDEGTHGGITCAYIQQSTTISLAALRRLRFPVEGKVEGETSARAQAVLAAIALHGAAMNTEAGWHLRSRCDLILEAGQKVEWESLGGGAGNFELDVEGSRSLLLEAISEAKAAGLPWNDEPTRLRPSPAFAQLVVQSQKARMESAEGE